MPTYHIEDLLETIRLDALDDTDPLTTLDDARRTLEQWEAYLNDEDASYV